MSLFESFADELEKLALTKYQKMWPTLSRASRRRLLSEAARGIKQLGESINNANMKNTPITRLSKHPQALTKDSPYASTDRGLRTLRMGLFTPRGESLRIDKLKAEALRQRAHRKFPILQLTNEKKVDKQVQKRGPFTWSGKLKKKEKRYRYVIAANKVKPSSKFIRSLASGTGAEGKKGRKAIARLLNTISPTHELAEVRAMKRPIQTRHRTSPKRLKKAGIPQDAGHGGIGPLVEEGDALMNSPKLQAANLWLRTMAPELPWIRTMKEHGWTPSRGLPSRKGLYEKMEKRTRRKLKSSEQKPVPL